MQNESGGIEPRPEISKLLLASSASARRCDEADGVRCGRPIGDWSSRQCEPRRAGRRLTSSGQASPSSGLSGASRRRRLGDASPRPSPATRMSSLRQLSASSMRASLMALRSSMKGLTLAYGCRRDILEAKSVQHARAILRRARRPGFKVTCCKCPAEGSAGKAAQKIGKTSLDVVEAVARLHAAESAQRPKLTEASPLGCQLSGGLGWEEGGGGAKASRRTLRASRVCDGGV